MPPTPKVHFEFATWTRHDETKEAGVHLSVKLKGASQPTAVFLSLADTARLVLAGRRSLKKAFAELPKSELADLEHFIESETKNKKFLGRAADMKAILAGD